MKRIIVALGLSRMTRDQWKYIGVLMILFTLAGIVSALVTDLVRA